MTETEFGKFVVMVKTYYSREERLLPNKEAISLWYEQLKDLPFQAVEAVLHQWVSTHPWSPSIADLREKCSELMFGKVPEWGEAWEKVLDAIRTYGSYDPKGAYETFDEITEMAVRQIGWFNLCMSANLIADRANFRQIYEELAGAKKKELQTPERMRDALSKVRVEMLEKREGK